MRLLPILIRLAFGCQLRESMDKDVAIREARAAVERNGFGFAVLREPGTSRYAIVAESELDSNQKFIGHETVQILRPPVAIDKICCDPEP